MADRFYTPDPIAMGEFVLSGPEAHHLATVRRLSIGDRVTLFNGDGKEYPAEVLAAGKKQVVLNVVGVEAPSRELPFALEIAVAMPKGDRGDFLIEKLVELGVTRFTPLETARTIVVPKESRLDNLRQAVIEASKQCGRNVPMQINPPVRWPAFLQQPHLPPSRWIFSTGEAVPLHVAGDSPAGGIVLAIGPEGGWETTELDAARLAGWKAVSLGPRILRVETAAITAAAWVSARG